MASFWSPFSHENAFCDSFSFFDWCASCLQKICPLPLPCCCSCIFLSHVNLTWFEFSTVPLGTVKIPLCIHSSGLVVRRIMAVMSLHVYFFKLGGMWNRVCAPFWWMTHWFWQRVSEHTMSPVESLYFSLTMGSLAEIGTVLFSQAQRDPLRLKRIRIEVAAWCATVCLAGVVSVLLHKFSSFGVVSNEPLAEGHGCTA